MLKSVCASWLLLAAIVAGSPAFSVNPPQAPQGLSSLSGVFGTQAGDYKFFQYDRTQLQAKYLDQVFSRSKEDRDYFVQSVDSIEKEFRNLLVSTVYNEGGLKWMSDQAKGAGQFFPAVDFLKSVNRFHQGRLALENKIEILTAMAGGALPSQLKIKSDGSGLEDAPNYGKIDFTEIKAFYATKLADVVKAVSNLQQNVIVANGAEYIIRENSGEALQLKAQGLLLSPDKIQELRTKVLKARRWGVKAHDAIDAYTIFSKNMLQKFVETYGTTERWRGLGEAEKAEREKDAKLIAEAFWTRSYLRTVYGMPIGAIGIHYDKKWFKLDILLNSTKSLSNFYEEVVWDQREMIRVAQNYRNAITRAHERAAKTLDGDLSFVASARNLMTYLAGHRNLAEALQMMLNLLAADLYEERLMLDADGLAQMKVRYRARYGSTPEDREFYSKLQKLYDPQGEEGDPGAAIGLSEFSLNGKFQTVLTFMRTKENELQQAETMQATIDAATGVNRYSNQRRQRIGDLFGEGGK